MGKFDRRVGIPKTGCGLRLFQKQKSMEFPWVLAWKKLGRVRNELSSKDFFWTTQGLNKLICIKVKEFIDTAIFGTLDETEKHLRNHC